jgi:rhamnose transport system substrate-binding protein|tara:strand:+ start:161 stop:1195 length:1035 start_codon:yes stop_codon:yes gene_type:complete
MKTTKTGNGREKMNFLKTLTSAAMVSAIALMAVPANAADTRIALVVKSLGNGFFDAAAKGAEEAAVEIGGIEIIYTGPTSATAEGQIEIINALIAQQVDAIAISANDPDALVPVLKKAMDRGIAVISWDSGVAAEGRQMHLNPSDTALIGETIFKLAADYLPDGGQVAILSASSTAANQNSWIDAGKEALPTMFPNIELVATVYGDDDSVKSTDEAKGLIASYPNLKAIIAPTTVGVVAAAQVVTDMGLIGKINVTGLALPSEFKQFIDSGASQAVALWNPIDLGYSAVYIANALATGAATAEPGSTISIGHVGEITLDDATSAAMAAPFTFDASNIEEFSKIY